MTGEIYECNQVPIIINIPNNAVKLTVEATLIDDDDSLFTVTNTLKLAEITEARIEAEYWEDKNVKYVLTDKARKEIENG